MQAYYGALPTPKSASLDLVLDLASRLQADMVAAMPDVRAQVANGLDSLGNGTARFRQDVVGRVRRYQGTYQGTSEDMYRNRVYSGWLGLYGFLGASALLLTISAAFAYHFGVVVSMLLTLAAATLVLLLAWAIGSGLVVMNDACSNAENIIVAAADSDPQMQALLQLYLQNIGASLPHVLKAANMLDTNAVSAGLQVASSTIINDVVHKYDVQYKMAGPLLDLNSLLLAANDQVAVALKVADRAHVWPQYLAVKSWGCCDVGAMSLTQWICLTACGKAHAPYAWLLAWCCGCGCGSATPRDWLNAAPAPAPRICSARSSHSTAGVAAPAPVPAGAPYPLAACCCDVASALRAQEVPRRMHRRALNQRLPVCGCLQASLRGWRRHRRSSCCAAWTTCRASTASAASATVRGTTSPAAPRAPSCGSGPRSGAAWTPTIPGPAHMTATTRT